MFFDVYVFIYQLFAFLFNLIIPVALILGCLWIIAKMLKGFIHSLSK